MIEKLALELNRPGTNSLVKTGSIESTITHIVKNYIYWGLTVAAFLAIIYAGYLFITSQGDSAKLTKAKNALLYTFLGIILTVLTVILITYFVSELGKL